MSASPVSATFAGADALGPDQTWGERHRLVRGLLLTAVSARLYLTSEPEFVGMARLGGLVGLLGGRRMRKVAAAALRALGVSPTKNETWRFAWSWWYQRAASVVLNCQADRLTPSWAERHVVVTGSAPEGGAILVSVHDFNQRLAFARLSSLVKELGAVSMFEPLSRDDPRLSEKGRAGDARSEFRARSRFSHQVFGPRVYLPRTAPRRGLKLLARGGSLIVVSDYFGREPARLLGKRWLVPIGPIWLAKQSGRPIVPYAISPTHGQRQRWQLWCGEPIQATPNALASALEECIRRSPTTWPGWPAWHEAPDVAG